MKKKKLIGFIVLLALIFLIYFYRDSVAMYTDSDYIQMTVHEAGIYGPLVFMLIYAVVLLVAFPAIPLSVAAGYIFGFWQGTIYVLIVATLMAAVGFAIPRVLNLSYQTTSRKGKQSFLEKTIRSLEKEIATNGFMNMLLVRPLIGYMLLSYAAGFIKKLKFRDFIFATIIMNLIFTPVYVFLGDKITSGIKGLMLPAVLILIVLLINIYIKQLKKKKK